MKIASKDIVIVEIRTVNDTRKNWFISLQAEEYIQCSYCDNKITEMKIPCDLCNQVYIMLILVLLLLRYL